MTTIAELHDPHRFAPVWQIKHAEVVKTIRPLIWKPLPVSILYAAANLAALLVAARVVAMSGEAWFMGIANACLGAVVGVFFLMPAHEWAHALAYRMLSASGISVRYDPRRMTAYCVADRAVVNQREMALVALAPFALLNALLLAGALLAHGIWAVFLAGALVFHVGACAGDFAIVNWLWLNGRSGEIYTYDDVAEGCSYFFRKNITLV